MPLFNGINSIIHSASTADFTAYTYSRVYASAAVTPTINGVSVPMTAGLVLDLLVRSIGTASTTNVFLIGDKRNTTNPGGTTGKVL